MRVGVLGLLASVLAAGCAMQTADGHDETTIATASELSLAPTNAAQGGSRPSDSSIKSGADPVGTAQPWDNAPVGVAPGSDPSPQPWGGTPRSLWTGKPKQGGQPISGH